MTWHRKRTVSSFKWLVSIATRSWRTMPQVKTRSKRKRRRPAMQHVAIDLGSRESQICIRSEVGEILAERLGGRLKSGQSWTPEIRPVAPGR
jgi:hypothetical protein